MPHQTQAERCSGAHCRCMDTGGLCQNMHWYHCKEHNPEAKQKHGSPEVTHPQGEEGWGTELIGDMRVSFPELFANQTTKYWSKKDGRELFQDWILNQIQNILSQQKSSILREWAEKIDDLMQPLDSHNNARRLAYNQALNDMRSSLQEGEEEKKV